MCGVSGTGGRSTGDTLETGGEDMDLTPIAQAVRKWRERSRARNELQRLTDLELADIGLSRGDIDAVVRGDMARARPSGFYEAR